MVKFFQWKKNNQKQNNKETKFTTTADTNITNNNNNKTTNTEKYEPPIITTTPRDTQESYRGSKKLNLENIDYNLQQLQETLPDPNLVIEQFIIGKRTRTKTYITYLKDVANPEIVKEVRQRLQDIKTDFVLDSSYIERNIENSTWSPFPQIEKTDKPHLILAALAQGRIAIYVQGNPETLLAPTTFFDLLDTPDDAYSRWFISASFYRVARYILFLTATFLPGLYIAITSYSPELFPTILAFTITASRVTTPFPVYLEAFLLMGLVEAIRMVMLRFPNVLGQTIAINTALTLALALLFANLVSAPVIIVATLTMLSSYGLPDFDLRTAVRMIQFFTMLMATFLGLYGLAIAFFIISIHLVTLKSLGIPYMAPFAPLQASSWGHTILRDNTNQMEKDRTYKPK